ncbi:MAG TPA: crotonyl-CoA carboxylase/reductase [Pyrinomonadaceae bacterium]|nr:crotonyl-CoA carboxylase/reductase [Pyrinomonadaceae bacterium]
MMNLTETELYEVGEMPPLGHVPRKMYAWVNRPERYGSPLESFKLEVVDVPEPGDDEALIYVMAAGINYNGLWAAQGKPVDVIAQRRKNGDEGQFQICGTDASAIVYKVGRNVTNLKVGQRVVAYGSQWDADCPHILAGGDPVCSRTYKVWGYETNWGSFAQFSLVQAHQCLPKPEHLTWEEAAAYMASGVCSYRMLHRWQGNAVRPGDVVLVWGGAGGVGCMAIQIAKEAGAIPVAVISDESKREFCMKLGAAGCINRTEFDHWGQLPPIDDREANSRWLRGGSKDKSGALGFRRSIWKIVGERRNPNIVIEHPGEDTLPTSMFVCESGGMVVICAGTTGYLATTDLRYVWIQQKRLQGSHAADDVDAQNCNDLVRAGRLDPCLSRTFSWDELPVGHQLMADNRHPPGNMSVLVGATSTGLGTGEPAYSPSY